METLPALLGKLVCVLTLEGRNLVGKLKGVDNLGNLVLEDTYERTFHLDKGMQLEPMGLYLVRGDSLFVAATRTFLRSFCRLPSNFSQPCTHIKRTF